VAKLFLDSAQVASWNEVPFVIDSMEIIGSSRHHVHKYPHQNGGDLEKLGRELYLVRMHALFDEGFTKAPYRNNYPKNIEAIMSYAEQGLTANLVTPQAGTIKAYCTDWPRKWSADRRSGESMDLTFIEDQDIVDLDVFSSQPTFATIEELHNVVVNFQYLDPSVDQNLFAKLRTAVNSVLAVRDQIELQLSLLEAKILTVEQLITQIDNAITTPIAYPLVNACIALYNAHVKLANDVTQNQLAVRTYVVPRLMTIMDVARAIFGRTDKAFDILQLNAVNDALAIPLGTELKYLVDIGLIRGTAA
jgi:hypothetical protein